MPVTISHSSTTRRRFAFWVGFGLFAIAEKTGIQAFDELAAKTTSSVPPGSSESSVQDEESSEVEHWTVGENAKWRWYERETLRDRKWVLTGISLPIDRTTGRMFQEASGYLDPEKVPRDVLVEADQHRYPPAASVTDTNEGRYVSRKPPVELTDEEIAASRRKVLEFGDRSEADAGKVSHERLNRHGRPPSKWLRSLTAKEIRIWLKTVEIPEAHVRGMTYWTHLTRDHSFDPERIDGLNEDEQAALHGAAHAGY